MNKKTTREEQQKEKALLRNNEKRGRKELRKLATGIGKLFRGNWFLKLSYISPSTDAHNIFFISNILVSHLIPSQP